MSCEHHRLHTRNSALRTQLAGEDLCGEEAALLGITELLGATPVIAAASPAPEDTPWPPFSSPSQTPMQRRRVCQVFPPDEPPPASSTGRDGG